MGRAGLSFQVGLPAHLRGAAARLYLDAFARKLGRVLGRGDRAEAFLVRAMRPECAIAGLNDDGGLVALAGFHDGGDSFIGGDGVDLRAAYGRIGAAWRGRLLAPFEREAPAGALLVDGVVVAPDWRGRGVGTALMGEVERLAWRRGKTVLRLEIVDGNARAFYERLGFRNVHTRRETHAKVFFGIDRIEVMEMAGNA